MIFFSSRHHPIQMFKKGAIMAIKVSLVLAVAVVVAADAVLLHNPTVGPEL
jgi:hypothetical protein